MVRRDRDFDKLVARLPKHERERILEHLSDPDFDPYQGDIRKVKGVFDTWSKRLGEYRVFYEVMQHEHTVDVFHVERRTTQTYRRGKHKR